MFEWPDLNNKKMEINGTCYAIKGQIGFLKNGAVVPCCLDSKGAIKIGDINNQDIVDILGSQRAKNMVEGFSKNLLVENLCRTCGFAKTRLG